jgi:hypothetical protein
MKERVTGLICSWIVQLVEYRETRAPVIKEAANDVIKQSDTCVPLFIISPQLQ